MAGSVAESPIAAPAPQLASLVSGHSGSRYKGMSPGIHLGLPSRRLTVVVSLSGPLAVAAGHAQPFGSFTALAAGLHTRPCRSHGRGR